jgi:hypothetical protein
MVNMNEETSKLIQELVNALSRGRRYTNLATKESYRADDVLTETYTALENAKKMGFECNIVEKED